ncbi:AAA family ATPase [Acidianus sp.]|uniref:nucleotide-binding protein n=1 Tax=Acidianus sp. TaxID=1872104 RepID=UPI00397DACE9
MRLSVLSTKGGVGKSIIALLLSKYFSQNGVKTLLIDRDPLGWVSNLAKIKGKGLLASIVDKEEDKQAYFKEVKTKDGGDFYILKLYGDGARFYVDLDIIRRDEKLYKKLRKSIKK